MVKVNRETMSKSLQVMNIKSCFIIIALVCFSCAERAPEINTVQPNYVSKSLFTGEWYFQQTVTEVAPEGSLGFAGYESSLEKIRWDP